MSAVLVGLNVSPSAADGGDPVGLARMAEVAGFDFVSSFDHPGTAEPSYETWTLLSWIAASTERIRLATRVLALPLRLPAMIAKAAESLARLSSGRLILGLGAGSNDDELTSYGAGTLSPAEKVRGLEEALEIIRRLWVAPSVTYAGRLHHVEAALLEPKPAQPIPIWLGTFGRRALELTGRLADGWIPSLGYVPDEQLVQMRAAVLESAERAGRDPAAVTCALHVSLRISAKPEPEPGGALVGPPAWIAEELGRWRALGFSAFSLSPTGSLGPTGEERAGQLETLATEILPVLRD